MKKILVLSLLLAMSSGLIFGQDMYALKDPLQIEKSKLNEVQVPPKDKLLSFLVVNEGMLLLKSGNWGPGWEKKLTQSKSSFIGVQVSAQKYSVVAGRVKKTQAGKSGKIILQFKTGLMDLEMSI